MITDLTIPLILGFENFPTQFGVRYEPLRRIADSPAAATAPKKQEAAQNTVRSLLGMTVKNIETDGEMSVYATAGHNGALVMAVEPDSEAQMRGILVSDVIVGWGDAEINCPDDLAECGFSESLPIAVLRKQRKTIL